MPKILYVIVVYNQKIENCNTYKTLFVNQYCNEPIYLFDNSPIAQHSIDEFNGTNIHYESDCTNPGLSAAYNRAATYAKSHNFDWILLLDQDTIFPANILDDYIKSVNQHPDIKIFAPRVEIQNNRYMSPIKINLHFNCKGVNIHSQIIDPKRYSVINSGMLINIDAFFDAGGYDVTIWLDYSDYLFIERFSTKYNQIYIIEESCFQEFSNDIHNAEQKLQRFKIFCNCVKLYPKKSLWRHIIFFTLVFKRALSISLFAKNFRAFKIAFSEYL